MARPEDQIGTSSNKSRQRYKQDNTIKDNQIDQKAGDWLRIFNKGYDPENSDQCRDRLEYLSHV